MVKRIHNKKECEKALIFARKEAITDQGRSFVQSCQVFFEQCGWLSEKQLECLYNMRPSPFDPDELSQDDVLDQE